LHRLKKVSLFFFFESLSNSVSSIGLVFRSVVDTYFDYLKSNCLISTTVWENLAILLCVNASLKQKFAARSFAFLFYLVAKLWFFKANPGILLYFPLFYWLFKGKFDIFVTVYIGNFIFWGSTDKMKLFVWTPSLYFYFRPLWRYSVWSLHCSIFGFERLCFQGPTCIHNNLTHSQVFHFKICSKSVIYKVKRCIKFYFFTYKSHWDTQLQVEVFSKALHVAGLSVLLVLILLSSHLRHFLFNLLGNQVTPAAVSYCCPTSA